MYGLGPFGGLPYGVAYTYQATESNGASQDVLVGQAQIAVQSSSVVSVECLQSTTVSSVHSVSNSNTVSVSTLTSITTTSSNTLVDGVVGNIAKQQLLSVPSTSEAVEGSNHSINGSQTVEVLFANTIDSSVSVPIVSISIVSCVSVTGAVEAEQVSIVLDTATVTEQPVEVVNVSTSVNASGVSTTQGFGTGSVVVEELHQTELGSVKLGQTVTSNSVQIVEQGQQVSLACVQQSAAGSVSTSLESNTVTLVYGQSFGVSQGNTLTNGSVSTVLLKEAVTVPTSKTVGNSPVGAVSGLQVVAVNIAQTKGEAPLAVSGMPQDIVTSNAESLLKGVGVSVGSGYNIAVAPVEERLNVTTLAVLQEIEIAMLDIEQATEAVIVEVELDLPDSQSISLVDVNQLNESVAVRVGSTVTVVSREAEQYTNCLLVGTRIADLSKLRVTLLSPSFTIKQVTKQVNVRSSTKIIGINL